MSILFKPMGIPHELRTRSCRRSTVAERQACHTVTWGEGRLLQEMKHEYRWKGSWHVNNYQCLLPCSFMLMAGY